MNEPIYELTIHFKNDNYGAWDSKSVAFSHSIDTLKAKACEDKRIYNQCWVSRSNSIELEIEDEYYQDIYIISQIKLI